MLGLLGNSGNTDAPHLHFHVMDGPSPLLANGLPYVFVGFEGEGVVLDENQLDDGRPGGDRRRVAARAAPEPAADESRGGGRLPEPAAAP